MPFISNLGELMRKKNLTYEELQFQSNVGPDTVARAKDGRIATCKLLTLEKLAEALDVEVSDLYRWERERKAPALRRTHQGRAARGGRGVKPKGCEVPLREKI